MKVGYLYGVSEPGDRRSLAVASAEDFMSRRVIELAEKRPVKLRVERAGPLARLIFVRPYVREVNRRLKPLGYALSARDRDTWTFTYQDDE